MDQDLTMELQGHSLPPSIFASSRIRAVVPAFVPAAGLCRQGMALCAAAIFAVFLSLASTSAMHAQQKSQPDRAQRTERFLAQRVSSHGRVFANGRANVRSNSQAIAGGGAAETIAPAVSPAQAMVRARAQHLVLEQQQHLVLQQQQASLKGQALPHATTSLSGTWQPLGPSSVVSPTYNNLSGRITAIAPDPNDATGNTVYLGTTGGGVWKSANAAGALAAATFTPLTDTLPVFSANAGTDAIASLSIGAVAVQPAANPVVIAGTGDPNDATDSLYGEGLLVYSTISSTWTLVQGTSLGTNGTYSFTGLATSGIAFSTTNSALVVAAFSTSPQAVVVDAEGSFSIPGLYYSTNAGQTWQMATIEDGSGNGTGIVQQPQPPGTAQVGNAATSVVWDAQRGMFFAAVRSHGYYSSPNGAVWTRLAYQPGTALTTANCPVGAGGAGDAATCPIFRGTLAVQPATGDLYALTVDTNNNDQGLWQDLCDASSTACATPAPVFANRIDNGALEVGGGSTVITQGNYNLALNAAPSAANATNLYVGTVDLYRCVMAAGSSSCTLRDTTNALDGCDAPAQVAPAQHALASVAQADGVPILYLGNDGGLWRSLTGVAETGSVCSAMDSAQFDNLNAAIGAGGSLAEVVGFAQDPSTANTLIAGLGTNGSAATSEASELTPWPQLSAGEGGFPSIDPNNSLNWYVAIGAGLNLVACPQGVDCNAGDFVPPATIGPEQVGEDASLLDAPTLLDPASSTSLLTGTCRVWRGPAANGGAWSDANAISPALGGITTPCSEESPLIRSLAAGGPGVTGATVQNSGSEVLYAGIAGSLDGGGAVPGHLFVTTTANTATSAIPWSDDALSPVSNDTSDDYVFNPYSFDVSAIYVDPHDATGATVYATVMGFGVPHVYYSTNFGASWLNVSSNLPDAPANAVVVDPNNASIVYVALDTGVYVTQNIASCGMPSTASSPSDCWTVFGTYLPNSPVVALAAAPNLPTGNGNDVGMLRAGTYGRGIWQMPLLTAGPPVDAAITLSAISLSFGPQQVQTLSTPQTLTVTNSGSVPVTIDGLSISGDFITGTDTCTGQTIAVGSRCTIQVVFAPQTTGALAGQLEILANTPGANIPGGETSIPLSGTGTTAASIVLTPLSLSFPATLVNQTSTVQNITISNTGGTTATLGIPLIGGETGDFSIYANTCGATLATQTGCTVSIVFTPTASGARAATLSVTDNVGTQTATLSGIGEAPATDSLSTMSLTFGQQQIGTTSAAQTVTLTNSGGVPLTLIAASLSPGDFAVVNACGNSLAAHSSCAINVTFAPTDIGTRTATLTIADQFRVQTVAVSGTGIAGPGVSLYPVTLTFPSTGVGLTAVAQTFTLTNNGGLPLAISSVAAGPGFIVGANTCGASLAIDTACTLTIVFAPTAPGTVSGTLTFVDNAPSGSQTTTLMGTGIDFALISAGPTSFSIASGASATYPLEVTSMAGLTGNVALTCTGAPANSICTVVPAVAALGGTVLVEVTVETGVTASSTTTATATGSSTPFRPRGMIVLALLLPVALGSRRRRAGGLRLGGLLLCVALPCILGVLSGCGTSRVIPTAGGGGTSVSTSNGTYAITVSGTSAGVTHSVALSLTVQ